MKIVIPTRGRVDRQITLNGLHKDLLKDTMIVCPDNEARYHTTRVQVVPQPDKTWTIARKRQWIIQELCANEEKIVMLDDDLRFCTRRTDDPKKFLKAKPEDVLQAFKELEEHLSAVVPHAGFAARGGSIGPQAIRGGWQVAKRMMYVLGYHVPTVLREAILGRIETREDMDLTLQLLRKGLPNHVNYSFLTDQVFASKGGCTDERTIERSNADAKTLAEWHAPYVTLKEMEYTSSIPRLEVMCRWQKLYEDTLASNVQAAG